MKKMKNCGGGYRKQKLALVAGVVLSAGLAFTGCDVNSDLQNENQSQSENQGTSQTYVLHFDDTLGGMNWRFADEDFVQPDDPEKTGYDFLGWFESGSDTAFSFENLNLNRNVFLTAKFAPTTYTVTYNLDGGTLADDAVKSYTVKDDDVDLTTTAIRAGYILDGWLLNDSKVTTISKDLLKSVSGKDIMLKANWLEAFTYSDEAKTIIKSLTSDAKNATEIVIPASVTSIGNSAFYGCSKLENVYYDGTIVDWCNITFDNGYSNPMSLASHFYMKDENGEYKEVKSLVIPDAVTEIKYRAFAGFDNLTSVTFEEGSKLTSIENSAFSGCSSLTSINIPSGVTSIGDSAFSYCSSLTSITIPSGVTSIGSDAFQNCLKLANVIFEEGSQLTSIGNYAFFNCSKLENVYYDGTIVDWCNISFNNEFSNPMGYASHFYMKDENGEYQEVIEIVIPDTVTEIKYCAFYGFDNLTSVTIGKNVISIGGVAFWDCSSLTTITIPSGVTSIGGWAFEKCSKLENVYYDGTIVDWCNITFDFSYSNPMSYASHFYMKDENGEYQEVTKIVIPDAVTEIKYRAFAGFDNLTRVTIGKNVISIGGVAFFGCSSLTSITIPASVTSIGNYAFSYCSSLTSITIPSGVTSIGDCAFYDCSKLETVTFEEGSQLTSIGEDAFFNCSKLENVYYDGTIVDWCNITFDDSYSNPMGYASHFYMKDENGEYQEVIEIVIPDTVTVIKDYAFRGFDNLTSVTIGKNVTSIGDSAFSCCSSLTSITIPSGVTSIGGWAFEYCSKLENVYYDGTIVDWCNITFDFSYSNPMSYASHFYMKDENGEYQEVTEIVIPDTVTEIKYCAFNGFDNLTRVTIGKNVTSIGEDAFYCCSKLETVTFEDANGWYVSTSSTATSGTKLTLTNTAQNATYLKSTYHKYYWKKSTT